ncbi:hypothetical protein DFH06DRAFT_1145877 [Mycena polygramma]|nr:hypothetical protein DFH06DRAFT_1145877 [Mycena polygramma]
MAEVQGPGVVNVRTGRKKASSTHSRTWIRVQEGTAQKVRVRLCMVTANVWLLRTCVSILRGVANPDRLVLFHDACFEEDMGHLFYYKQRHVPKIGAQFHRGMRRQSFTAGNASSPVRTTSSNPSSRSPSRPRGSVKLGSHNINADFPRAQWSALQRDFTMSKKSSQSKGHGYFAAVPMQVPQTAAATSSTATRLPQHCHTAAASQACCRFAIYSSLNHFLSIAPTPPTFLRFNTAFGAQKYKSQFFASPVFRDGVGQLGKPFRALQASLPSKFEELVISGPLIVSECSLSLGSQWQAALPGQCLSMFAMINGDSDFWPKDCFADTKFKNLVIRDWFYEHFSPYILKKLTAAAGVLCRSVAVLPQR